MSVVENVRVYGLEESIVASGYPMFKEKLSMIQFDELCCDIKYNLKTHPRTLTAIKLATTNTGEGHDNFLNGVIVQFDLTLPVKVWTEAQRYHFFDFVSSMSTMHKLTQMNLDNVYIEYVDGRIINIMNELQDEYINNPTKENKLKLLYNNPNGCKLTARMTTNYRQLKTIYKQRKNHLLPEWNIFCEWIKTLPLSEMITGERKGEVKGE